MTAPKRPKAPSLTLHITREILDDAVHRDSSHCLWAEAVKVAFPDARRVSVDIQTIRFTDPTKGLRYTYLTPRTAQVSIVQWDQGIFPEPHSVQIRRGQVTRAGQAAAYKAEEVSEARKKQREDAAKKGRAALAKTTLRKHANKVPERVGGKTPPIAAGKRRAFGLRGLEY